MTLREAVRDLPALLETEGKAKIAKVKFFNPCGNQTWFPLEFDGNDDLFGYDCQDGEYSYFSLSEMEKVRTNLGLGIEVDTSWVALPLEEAIALEKKAMGLHS
jgi:hypothetical protein